MNRRTEQVGMVATGATLGFSIAVLIFTALGVLP